MIASTVCALGAGAIGSPPASAALMWLAKCAATRGAAALAPPYRAVSMDDHCRLQMMVEAVLQIDRGARWISLRDPVRVVDVRNPEDLPAALHEVETLTREHGYHAAGFVTYEAGRAFELRTCMPDPRLPLAWFALFGGKSTAAAPAPAAPAAHQVT